MAGTATADILRAGDLLLSIDDRPVTRFREVEKSVQKPEVAVVVWRNQSEYRFDIPTTVLDGRGVRRAIVWNGTLLQAPYRQMAAQRGITPTGVYVAYFSFGSPASRAGLGAGSRIVEVDGQPVPDLDSFIDLVRDRTDREFLRLTTVAWNESVRVINVQLDHAYWPSWEIRYNGDWHRVPFGPDETAR